MLLFNSYQFPCQPLNTTAFTYTSLGLAAANFTTTLKHTFSEETGSNLTSLKIDTAFLLADIFRNLLSNSPKCQFIYFLTVIYASISNDPWVFPSILLIPGLIPIYNLGSKINNIILFEIVHFIYVQCVMMIEAYKYNGLTVCRLQKIIFFATLV